MEKLEKLVIAFRKEYETVLVPKYSTFLEKLGEELKEHGIALYWKFTDIDKGIAQNEKKDTAPAKEAGPTVRIETDTATDTETDTTADTATEAEATLYLTDSPRVLEMLQLCGLYAAALCHEANQGVSFHGNCYILEGLESLEYAYVDSVYRRLAGIPSDILETERLRVRESTVADVDDFYRIYAEPSITYYMENLFEDPDMERSYMKNYIRRIYGFYGYGMWTVILKETGQVIGRAGLSVRDGYEEPELGFVIDKALQRQGYAKEVCIAILDYARTKLQFDKVQALAEPGNEASKHLLTKLGFLREKKVQEAGRVYWLFKKML